MKQAYLSGAVPSVPQPSQATSVGFPTLEDTTGGVPGTVPGPFWFHAISKEVENVIEDGGIVPAVATLTQLRDAIRALIAASMATIEFPEGIAFATPNQHLSNNPSGALGATPLGVRGMLRAMLPTGTRMVFYQPSAPTGWTKVVSVNDRVLRVVSGAGGSTGGNWQISGVTIGGTTLTVNQMPAHTHSFRVVSNRHGGQPQPPVPTEHPQRH